MTSHCSISQADWNPDRRQGDPRGTQVPGKGANRLGRKSGGLGKMGGRNGHQRQSGSREGQKREGAAVEILSSATHYVA